MTKQKKIKIQSQQELLMEFYKKNSNRDIPHSEIVDWATTTWKKQRGTVFRDPDRGIRKLCQTGFLVKVKKGVYHYDPHLVTKRNLEDFTVAQKKKILKRDNSKCVMCGQGKSEGLELHIDHIKPKDLGGKATLVNGQVLCSQHNFMKKNLKHTEAGKKMFIRLYKLAKKEEDKKLQNFCTDILRIYKNHNINGHIEWKK